MNINMDGIEITVISADETLSCSYNPIEFKNTFNCDWNVSEITIPIKSSTTDAQAPLLRVYKREPDTIRHRRNFNYDGMEVWISIRVVLFKEVV